ncbi:MAG: hypothetical protein L0Z73_16070 [Gammaproteobacteria bacterium]|nr:hypothetical protein [Gammaproteobacteria bacterium]
MASIFDLANMAAMTYHHNKFKHNDWIRLTYHGNLSGKGFYGETFANRAKKEVVVAFRGTDAEAKDWNDF